MAKQAIKEVTVNTHKLSAVGVLHVAGPDIVIITEDGETVTMLDLLKNFHGDLITLKVTNQQEEE